MITNLRGRLRNTDLPLSKGLLPLFEAVANAIQAIDELEACRSGRIRIRVVRDPQMDFSSKDRRAGRQANPDIMEFEVVDDGAGFTKANMQSFRTLDSDHKVALGGRGVGRLLWLKAFERVEITSCFPDENGALTHRDFTFSVGGIAKETIQPATSSDKRGTTVKLIGFAEQYRNASPKTGRSLANSLLQHCLWYFIRPGGAPKIEVLDDEKIDLADVYEEFMATSTIGHLRIKDIDFDLVHLKVRGQSNWEHSIALCAASRVVREEKLRGRVPGLNAPLGDSDGLFGYQCYVTSDFLDKRVRPERTAFDLSEKPDELLPDELSLEEILKAVSQQSAEYLAESLQDIKERGRARIDDFVANRSPRYRPIVSLLSENELAVDPGISDKDLELKLHEYLFNFESSLLREGQQLMQPKAGEDEKKYSAKLQAYLSKIENIKASDLASYVFHRKVVIDLLQEAIERDDQGKYRREDAIHQLIVPMRIDSESVQMLDANLWLIDESLAFHNYLASDKPISAMPITDSDDRDEPDICCLQIYDNPLLVNETEKSPLGAITIVEIKRPMRNDATTEDKDPVAQASKYLKKIRNGRMKTAKGRPIVNAPNVPAYCYIVCDLTPSIRERCEDRDLTPRADQLGYFGYLKNRDAYIQVISLDLLVNLATERNRAFFERLGLPT